MMRRWMMFLGVGVLACGSRVGGATTDSRNFELLATAPPEPALKYTLLFDASQRHSGNAALQYAAALELLNDPFDKQVADTVNLLSESPRKMAEFDAAAVALDRPAFASLLEIAARCDRCDWEVPMKEQGSAALLPHLNNVRHVLASFLTVRAVYEARHGNVDKAIELMRLQCELGRNIGEEPILISGMVGESILSNLETPLTELMNRPESPNLYWALASLPRPLISLQHCWGWERAWLSGSFHELTPERMESLSAQDWRSIFTGAVEIARQGLSESKRSPAWLDGQAVDAQVQKDLPAARQVYAEDHDITADQAGKLDAFKVVAWYWFEQYRKLGDQEYKITSLPWPMMIAQAGKMQEEVSQVTRDEPANVFLEWIPNGEKAALRFARVDRTLAALTDVEAIRSYAAAHDGKLPASLAEITDTPALDNPMTGRAFEYKVEGDVATLSDLSDGDNLLSYSVKIRK